MPILTPRTHIVLLSNQQYYEKVLSTAGANLVAYWPLWEASGAVAQDISGNGFNGTYSNVTLGQVGIGDGRTAPLFNGTTSYVNVHSAGLAAAFNGAEGTISVWWQHHALSHNDGVTRQLVFFLVNGNNYVSIQRIGANSNLRGDYKAGGTLALGGHTIDTLRISWSNFVVTWSATDDQVIYYDLGLAYETDISLGVWDGASTIAIIGANNTTPTQPYYGYLAHAALWDRALTPGEIAGLARV